MFLRDCDPCFSKLGTNASNREAIDGFSALAAALDRGLCPAEPSVLKAVDALAIGFGWIALAAVIYFPTLQLAAIATWVAIIGVRSVANYLRGLIGQRQTISFHKFGMGFASNDKWSFQAT